MPSRDPRSGGERLVLWKPRLHESWDSVLGKERGGEIEMCVCERVGGILHASAGDTEVSSRIIRTASLPPNLMCECVCVCVLGKD